MANDDQNAADSADEEITDGKSVLGHAPEDVEDVDDTLASVGLDNDEDGIKELNSQAVIDRADKNQQ